VIAIAVGGGTDDKDAYDALAEELDVARSLTDAATAAGRSPSERARTMNTSRRLLRTSGGNGP
jgi:hypothetical protein